MGRLQTVTFFDSSLRDGDSWSGECFPAEYKSRAISSARHCRGDCTWLFMIIIWQLQKIKSIGFMANLLEELKT